MGVLDRGRHEHHEHLERHACPEAVFDRSPSVFAVAEAHVDRILAEGIDRAHSHDRGTSAATGRASPLAPTDCPDSLAPACFAQQQNAKIKYTMSNAMSISGRSAYSRFLRQ